MKRKKKAQVTIWPILKKCDFLSQCFGWLILNFAKMFLVR